MNTSSVLDGVIQQFGSRLACLRELIQNAIDAGTDRIEVRFEREAEWGVISVEDFGSGMTLDHIETFLLNVFRSSKEGDREAIGKFGIGFVSVFALEPAYVIVDTSRDGEDTRLVIDGDLSLRYLTGEPRAGTRVSLYLATPESAFNALRREAKSFLLSSCRYVDVELVLCHGTEEVAINRPFELDLPLTSSGEGPGGARIIVGFGQHAPTTTLMNRRLILHSGPGSIAGGATTLATSHDLEHNMARNAVIQDERYHQLVLAVQRLTEHELLPRLLSRLRERKAGVSTLAAVGHVLDSFGDAPAVPPWSALVDEPAFDTLEGAGPQRRSLGWLLEKTRAGLVAWSPRSSTMARAVSKRLTVVFSTPAWPVHLLLCDQLPEGPREVDVDFGAAIPPRPSDIPRWMPLQTLASEVETALPIAVVGLRGPHRGNAFAEPIPTLDGAWLAAEPVEHAGIAIQLDHPLAGALTELATRDRAAARMLLTQALAACGCLPDTGALAARDRWFDEVGT